MIISETDKKILTITSIALIITSILIITGLFFESSLAYRYVIITAFIGYVSLAMYGLYLIWTLPEEVVSRQRKYVRFVDQDPTTPEGQIKLRSPALYKMMEKERAFDPKFPKSAPTPSRRNPIYIREEDL
jgi:hypothetical protein